MVGLRLEVQAPSHDMSAQSPFGLPERTAQGGRLDSWKEIASYLKRDVRTVQRWEKTEGLPVHRHLHEKQGTVYAFKSEIDEWARERTLPEEETGFVTRDVPQDEDQANEVPSAGGTDGELKLAPPTDSGNQEPSWQARLFGYIRQKHWLAVMGLAAIGAVGVYAMWPLHHSVVLAVLPLKNLGGPDQEALVDGITTETKIRLENIQPDQMGVLLLTKRYVDVPPREIASSFNANYVLKGSAKIVGQQVSIAAQLARADQRSSVVVWRDEYKGDLRDIQVIQNEVSASIARAVLHQVANVPPTQPLNTEAYEAYQWGAYFLNKRTTPDLLKALEYFEKAEASDPAYAPAYAGLAATYSLLGSAPYTQLSPKDSYSKAEAAARRALQLDESLAEAHLSLGYALLVYERNYDKARQEFERAIKLRPGYATAHDYYAYYLTAMGEMNKAIEEREAARKLDPISPLLTTALGEAYYQNRQYDLAIRMAEKALELDQSYPVSMINLARSYEQSGMHTEARGIYLKLLTLAPEDPGVLALLGHEYAVSGEAEKARKIEARLEQLRNRRYVAALYIAMIWTGLGDREQAFLWLNRAYDEDCEYLVYLRTEPMADPLRSDPRFSELLRKLGLRAS